MKNKRLRKRFTITTIVAFSIGVLFFAGAQFGSNPSPHISEAPVKAKAEKRVRGKYAAKNSEKAKFIAAMTR